MQFGLITKGSIFIPLEAGEEFIKKLKGILSSKKLKMGAEKNESNISIF